MSTGGAGDPVSKTESFNQAVRGFCVIILLLAFVAAFLWGVWQNQERPVIDGAVFYGAVTLGLTWFSKSRDEQQRRTDIAAQAAAAPPSPPPTTTP